VESTILGHCHALESISRGGVCARDRFGVRAVGVVHDHQPIQTAFLVGETHKRAGDPFWSSEGHEYAMKTWFRFIDHHFS
jgi:hypothetical protein